MKLVAVGCSGPAFRDRERAARVWLAATAAHGTPTERANATNALAALGGGATLDPSAERWLERVANCGNVIRREWARYVLLRARMVDQN